MNLLSSKRRVQVVSALVPFETMFSKKIDSHGHAVTLHFMHCYNFVRVHKTLQVTPAMGVGIAIHVWSFE